MYNDFKTGSMMGYLLMIIITSLLAFYGKRSNHTRAIIIGNLASALVSYYFISTMSGDSRWDGIYFKPFGPTIVFIWVSFLNLIPQFISMKLAVTLKRK